ncbi:MFS general substrate transporter [Gymnopilus junonius]|uniref:MFS general substrate transporter n=1 Tax=Gymnopilus junonius TaxID=109634 RepID=A0A9P5NHP3_GYMJU|nr:MFS general substrate transporter [Gymnopilus junonius]KAF8892800.1 MFS general substrate transporter [Gymnopilus junonius]
MPFGMEPKPRVADDNESQQSSTLKVPDDGGSTAWLTVLGAWLVMFSTFGYLYSFGVYQDFYTRFFLSTHSPSKIAWIGSFQLMMPFGFGVVSGKLFDSGYFHLLQLFGSCIFVISLFMLSLAREQQYSDVFLSQAVGMGIGLGCTFIPTVSVVSHHFNERKVLATGIVMSGSSLGAVIFPIMINNLIKTIGFAKTVRASAYIVFGLLIIANAIMRPAYPKDKTEKPKLNIKAFFTDVPYILGSFGALISMFGFYFPLIYLQLYAVEHGIDSNLAFYSIATLNAASTIGRVFGNYIAHHLGSFNVGISCTLVTAASIFAVFGVHNSASLIIVSIFHGLFAGAWLSVSVAALSTLARHPHEVGSRIGIALAFSSFGSLGSAPVQGALLTSTYIWSRPIIFSGVLMVAASFVFLLARMVLAKERGTWRV